MLEDCFHRARVLQPWQNAHSTQWIQPGESASGTSEDNKSAPASRLSPARPASSRTGPLPKQAGHLQTAQSASVLITKQPPRSSVAAASASSPSREHLATNDGPNGRQQLHCAQSLSTADDHHANQQGDQLQAPAAHDNDQAPRANQSSAQPSCEPCSEQADRLHRIGLWYVTCLSDPESTQTCHCRATPAAIA